MPWLHTIEGDHKKMQLEDMTSFFTINIFTRPPLSNVKILFCSLLQQCIMAWRQRQAQ